MKFKKYVLVSLDNGTTGFIVHDIEPININIDGIELQIYQPFLGYTESKLTCFIRDNIIDSANTVQELVERYFEMFL